MMLFDRPKREEWNTAAKSKQNVSENIRSSTTAVCKICHTSCRQQGAGCLSLMTCCLYTQYHNDLMSYFHDLSCLNGDKNYTLFNSNSSLT